MAVQLEVHLVESYLLGLRARVGDHARSNAVLHCFGEVVLAEEIVEEVIQAR